MSLVNRSRFLGASVAASAVLFIAAGIVNAAWLGPEWQSWLSALGPNAHPPSNGVGFGLWLIVALLFGFSGAWIYWSAVDPLANKKRAWVAASLCLCATGWATSALGQLALGVTPARIVLGDCFGGAVGVVFAMLAVAAIYRTQGASE